MNWKKILQPDYMSYSAREFARDNDILYLPIRSHELRISGSRERNENSLLLADDRCIILHPPNDGMPTFPFVFYRKTESNKYVGVMDNQRAFCEITNISEILLQISWLYEKYIDKPVFLDPMCFAVMLLDPIDKNYHGRGKLAVTDDTLCNNKVKPREQNDARKCFYNVFLDHFIGWNFGKAVSGNKKLQNTLSNIVRLLEETNLRESAGTDFNVWGSKDVWHVKYADDGTPEIIRF